MSQEYYAMYNTTTLIPISVGGSPMQDVPDGYAVTKINSRHGHHVMAGTGHMTDYFVKLINGQDSELTYRLVEFVNRKVSTPNNTVQDLNYKVILIDNFDIRYTYVDNIITLTLDFNQLTPEYQQKFFSSITATEGSYDLYITEYRDVGLLAKMPIDLVALSKTGTLEVPFESDKTISLWITKNDEITSTN